MGSFGDYAENKILDHIVGKTSFTMPATVAVGLFTVTPTDAGGGTEVTGGSYARKTTAGTDWDAASGGSIANAQALAFPTATADWGTVVAFGIFDATSGGNLLAWGAVTPNKAVASSDTASFAVGALTITLD